MLIIIECDLRMLRIITRNENGCELLSAIENGAN